jgi:hypothetical protein
MPNSAWPARQDPAWRQMMTMRRVGTAVALTFPAAVDRAERFSSFEANGPCFGLMPDDTNLANPIAHPYSNQPTRFN